MRNKTAVLAVLVFVLSACTAAATDAPAATPSSATSADPCPTTSHGSISPVSNPTAPDGANVATGTIETSLGSVKWWRVSNSVEAIPYPDGGLVETASGYLAAGTEWDPGTGFSTDSNLWHSPDGLNWQVISTPMPARPTAIRIMTLAGEVWLETLGPSSLWRSPEGGEWTEVCLPESSDQWNGLFEVAGHIWLTSSKSPTVWQFDEGGWLTIASAGVAHTDATGVPWTVSWSRPAVGADAVVIAWGWEWLGVRISESVMAISAGAISNTPAPWSRITTGGIGSEPESIISTASGFVFYVGTETENGSLAVEKWTSVDGAIWEGPRIEDFGLGDERISRVRPLVTEPQTLIGITTEWGEHLMIPEDESADPHAMPSAMNWRVFQIGSGWLALGQFDFEIYGSDDLTSWQGVDLFEAELPLKPEGVALPSEPVRAGRGDVALVAGDRLFIMTSDGDPEERRLWMLDISP